MEIVKNYISHVCLDYFGLSLETIKIIALKSFGKLFVLPVGAWLTSSSGVLVTLCKCYNISCNRKLQFPLCVVVWKVKTKSQGIRLAPAKLKQSIYYWELKKNNHNHGEKKMYIYTEKYSRKIHKPKICINNETF